MFRQREQVRLFDQDLQGRGHVRIARRLISRQNASVSSQIGNVLGNKLRGGHTYSPQWLFDRTYWMALSGPRVGDDQLRAGAIALPIRRSLSGYLPTMA